jgi:hypothetical protein
MPRVDDWADLLPAPWHQIGPVDPPHGNLSALGGSLAGMTCDQRAVARLLAKQYGVLSRAQAAELGFTPSSLRHSLRPGGRWQRMLPAVYATFTGTPTQKQLEIAAVLYAGPRSVVTGPAALGRHQIRALETSFVDVLVPHSRKCASSGFVLIHRTRRMPEWILDDGVVTFALPARAVTDTVQRVHRLSDARAVVAGAVQQGRCTVQELYQELAQGPRRGTTLLRSVLAEVADGIRSAAEGDLRDLILKSGLPVPLFNPRLYVNHKFLACPDAWWPQASLAAEVDSRQWHTQPDHWEYTMRRHDQLISSGIAVLHFSPRQLRTEFAEVVRTIAGALRNGRPATGIVTRLAAG